MSRFFQILPVIFLLVAPSSQGLAAQAADHWTTGSPAPTERTEVAAARLNDLIYVVGGFEEPSLGNILNFAISDRVEAYDPHADTWVTKAPLPSPLHHAGIASVDGRLYVIGGFTRSALSVWHPVGSVYMYDPDQDAWKQRSPMPTARGALGVTAWEGKIFAIGGFGGERNSAAVEVYDPSTDTWTRRATLPTPRDHLAAVALGDRIYAIGGRRNLNYAENLATLEAYHPAENQWTQKTPMPTPRSGLTAATLESAIYVLGGESVEGTFSTNEVYLPQADRWETANPMPTARHGLGSAVIENRLYVLCGGPSPGGSFSNLVEIFSPVPVQSQTRAPARHVRTIMALLATFQEAGTLPPDQSPDGNRLIRTLIQSQAALMKSDNPAVAQLLQRALEARFQDRAVPLAEEFRVTGWTAQTLEAVVMYMKSQPVWTEDLTRGFQAFNIGPREIEYLGGVVQQTSSRFRTRGQSFQAVYSAKYQEFLDGKLSPSSHAPRF